MPYQLLSGGNELLGNVADTPIGQPSGKRHRTTTPLAAAMRVVGGRWKLLVLWQVHLGSGTVKALRESIRGISPKMLYQQLRELVDDGLLARDNAGRKFAYRLTLLGRSLLPLLHALEAWSLQQNITERAFRRR